MVGGRVGSVIFLQKSFLFFSTQAHEHAHALTHTPMSRCHS